jgi:signal recognition particle receptor subunit beta
MATINFARREIEAKIVYVGPALSGKTTNVQVLHRLVPKAQRGELHQLATETDRTLFFDFIPVELGQIAGFTAHFKLFTVPGQVYYQQTRKAVLQGADGVVFVADSSAGRSQANVDAMIDLEENLRAHGMDIATMPLVVQLNKRDVDDAVAIETLLAALNPHGVPVIESIASSGYGVLDTLYKVTEIATKRIRENLSGQKNALRLQAVQQDERETEQQVVDDYVARINKFRPEEEASAERLKEAGRLRPDDVDSFLMEFVEREDNDDDLLLDDGLPGDEPAVAAPEAPSTPKDARPVGSPPSFLGASSLEPVVAAAPAVPAPAPRVAERQRPAVESVRPPPSKSRYAEGAPIEARIDAQALSGVLLREVIGTGVGADGRATIEIVLERGGVPKRHLLRFVDSTPETPWGMVTAAGIIALILGFAGGVAVGSQFL